MGNLTLLVAAALATAAFVRTRRKRRPSPRLSREAVRATAGFAAEKRQRKPEEQQQRRAPRRYKDWSTPGASSSNNVSAPSETTESQQLRSGAAAEERQQQHEERQSRRAPRRNQDWSANTPGASGSDNNLSTPHASSESQQQPSRQQTVASAEDGHDGVAPSRSFVPSNPLWFPPQYEPNRVDTQPDLSLHTREVVLVFDAGMEAHRGTATLDTGNGGCTLITKRFAGQLGLVDFDGNPTQAHLRKTRVQGVVAGAYEWLPQINIQYEIKDAELDADVCTEEGTLRRRFD